MIRLSFPHTRTPQSKALKLQSQVRPVSSLSSFQLEFVWCGNVIPGTINELLFFEHLQSSLIIVGEKARKLAEALCIEPLLTGALMSGGGGFCQYTA